MAKPQRGRPRKLLTGAPLPHPLEKRWTVVEIAVAHGFTPAAIIAKILAGELAAEKSGKEWRVTDSAYRDWVRRITFQPRPMEVTI